MRFETIRYMEWFKTRAKVRFDLCPSGVENFALEGLKIDLDELEITGENVYGYIPLLEAIGERYGVKADHVVSTVGTSHALFLVCGALLETGDEVFVELPSYEPLLAVPRSFGARVLRFERVFEEGYQWDVDRLRDRLSPRTKLIILTNLHNPSGALLPRCVIKEISGMALKRGIPLVVDEIYLEFMDGEEGQTSFHLSENVIVISSLTKVYGLGGLRCGWVLASPELARRMRRIIDYTNVEGVYIGEQISFAAFSRLDSIKRQNQERILNNKRALKDFIENEEKLSWVEPAGGVLCFPRVEGVSAGDRLAHLLREEYDTAVVPGSFFEDPRHFRLGFDVAPEVLTAALKNIHEALKELPPSLFPE